MLVKHIKKKAGGHRMVAMPSDHERGVCNKLYPALAEIVQKKCDPEIVHGFMRGRNIVTNARKHVGFKHSLSFDLANFFNSITLDHIHIVFGTNFIASYICSQAPKVEGRYYPSMQGIPSSPDIANVVGAHFIDRPILKMLKKLGGDIVYTRYADDLTFSFNDIEYKETLLRSVPEIAHRCGLPVAPKKTKFMHQNAGRRVICGVAVDETGIYPSRKIRRKLRAAQFQSQTSRSTTGLKEFCKLKTPMNSFQRQLRSEGSDKHQIEIYRKLLERFPGAMRKSYKHKKRMQDMFDGQFLITRDVAYMTGASTFTTNWRSCLSLAFGCFRRKVTGWADLKHAAIATLLSDEWMEINGVRRKKMKARTYLLMNDEGRLGWMYLYGESFEAKAELKDWLEKNGIYRFTGRSFDRVNLHRARPYLDHGSLRGDGHIVS